MKIKLILKEIASEARVVPDSRRKLPRDELGRSSTRLESQPEHKRRDKTPLPEH